MRFQFPQLASVAQELLPTLSVAERIALGEEVFELWLQVSGHQLLTTPMADRDMKRPVGEG